MRPGNAGVQRRFVRYISHEIRIPLNAVCMGLELLWDKVTTGGSSEVLLEVVNDSMTSCDNAVLVLNDLLTFDKMERGALLLELETVDVMSLIRSTVQPFFVQVYHVLPSVSKSQTNLTVNRLES